MKLSTVLLKYLIANKQLSLPGIGTFTTDGAYNPDVDGKKTTILNNVNFNQEKIGTADDELIEFIAKETGKMKVLASADLLSQLDDAIQFINTGKPYYFTGIGTITKKTDGSYDFSPDKYTPASEKKKERKAAITEKNTIPQSYIDNTTVKPKKTAPAIILITLALIAIAATVWFYIKNSEKENASLENETVPTNTSTSTPVTNTPKTDTVAANTPIQTASVSNTYTYVLEVTKEPRATKRYNQLKNISWPVELEIVDSVYKRIIMKLPKAGSDSTRIKDSLSALSGRKVFISN
ncbi:MAG: hypothetical protein ACK5NK_04670 [Niabella sp.]